MAAIAFLILLALLATPALACSCASSPVQYCERLPDPNNSQQAVFVGMVREFYPRSRDQMSQLFDEFYRTHRDLAAKSTNRASKRLAGAPPDNQDFRKQFIQYLWGNALTTEEQEQLRTADQRELDHLMFDYRRRARVQVLENFANADSPEFELYTNLDGPSCGFDFAEGGVYLIEAYRNGPGDRWKVSTCSRTKLASEVAGDVNALRASKNGVRLPGRIVGQVFGRTGGISPAGVRIQLLGGKHPLEAISDSQGQFEFTNLESGSYQLVWTGPAPRNQNIDLTRERCARVFVPLDGR